MFRRNVPVLETAAVGSYHWCKDKMNPGIGRGHNLMLEKGQGTNVWDTEGKKYIDFACGIGAGNLGHCHPRLVKVVQKQAGELWHSPVPFGVHSAMRDLLVEFEKQLPKELDNFMFTTTGAEAVEAALKIARQATGRQNTVVLQGAFHGRTVGTAGLSMSKSIFARHMRPLMPGVVGIPVPYPSQLMVPNNTPTEDMVEMAFEQAKLTMRQQTEPNEVALMIAEPVLGEGGYFPLPKSYLQKLQGFCKDNGILFAIDEVQSGFGRTGAFFNSIDQLGVTPDVLIFAKGFANGLPLSGVVSKREFSDKCLAGTMGGTYAGNVVACRSATEVMKIMKEENIFENVASRHKQLVEGLKSMTIRNTFPIQEVRGRGLMIAMQMLPHIPAGTSAKVVDACTKRGLIVMNTSLFETLRLIPPLNCSEADMATALTILEESLVEIFTNLGDAAKAGEGKGWSFLPCCSAEDSCQPNGAPCRHIAQ